MAVLKDLIVHGRSRFVNGAQFNTINAESIGADAGIFNKLIATSLDAKTATIDNLTAKNATVTALLDVQGELHTNSWSNANIATIDGSFYISPTSSSADGSDVDASGYSPTGTITYSNNNYTTLTVTGTFNTSQLSLGNATNVAWPANSYVIITGDVLIGNEWYPLGTIRGKLQSQLAADSNSKTITIIPIGATIIDGEVGSSSLTDGHGLKPQTLEAIRIAMPSAVTGITLKMRKIKVSMTSYGGTYQSPIGIFMTAMGSNKKTFLDIYGGSNNTTTIPSGSGALALPTVRIGNLEGMPVVGGITPHGWGIYTNNGFFTGTIVAQQGKIGNGSAAWTIGNDTQSGAAYIYTGTRGSANSAYISTGLGTESIADSGTLSGTKWAYTAGANFGVTMSGILYAKGAQLSGNVAATQGFTVTSSVGGATLASMTGNGITLGQTGSGKFNILITDSAVSDKGPGILLRQGTNVLNEIKADGMNVYVNNDRVARFGEESIIGRISTKKTNISINQDGLKLNYTGTTNPAGSVAVVACGVYGYAGSPIIEKDVAQLPGSATVALQHTPTSNTQITIKGASTAGNRTIGTFTAGTAATITHGAVKVAYDGVKTLTFSKVPNTGSTSSHANVYYYTNEESNRVKGGYITIGTSIDIPFINTLTIGSSLQTARDQQIILGQYNEPDETAYITIGTGTSSNDLLNEFVIRNIKDLVLDIYIPVVKNDYNIERIWYPSSGPAQTINIYSGADDSLITTIDKTDSATYFYLSSELELPNTDSIYYSYIPNSEGIGITLGKNNQTGQYSIATGLKNTALGYGAIGHGMAPNEGSNILANGIGVLAQGYAIDNGTIGASGPGSIAIGYVHSTGMINTQGAGSIAFGQSGGSSLINAMSTGSVAFGHAMPAGNVSSKIITDGECSISGGMASGSTIRARTSCSIAFGYAEGSSIITAYSSNASIAMGSAHNGYMIRAERTGNVDPNNMSYAVGLAYNGHLEAREAGSRAVNESTLAYKRAQTALGSLNIADTNSTTCHPSGDTRYGQYAVIIGNGTNEAHRSNALTVDWSGNIMAQGMAGMIQMTTCPAGGPGNTPLIPEDNTTVYEPIPGWLICNGAAVSRTEYATLFAVIGTNYGAGDGSTTFNLPDFRGRVPVGAGQGTASDATSHALGDPNGTETVTLTADQSGQRALTISGGAHSHTFYYGGMGSGSRNSLTVYNAGGTGNYGSGGTHTHAVAAANATEAHSNMQPYLVINYIICTGKTS